jgi:hypothetical protein
MEMTKSMSNNYSIKLNPFFWKLLFFSQMAEQFTSTDKFHYEKYSAR